MRAILAMIVLSSFLFWTPDKAAAEDRDRYDRYYGKDRDHYAYQVDRGRDHRWGREIRHARDWKRQHRPERYWKKHRRHRHAIYHSYRERIVYRPAPVRVIYREPVVYYPASYLTIGVPNLSFRVSW